MFSIENYASAAEILRPKKKSKKDHLSSITIGYLAAVRGSRKAKNWKRLRILFDSGCGATLVNESFCTKLKQKVDKKTKWKTHEHREITWNCYVDETDSKSCKYDMIIGRDLMHEIGIDILFSKSQIVWDNASIPMESVDKLDSKYVDHFEQELLFIHYPISTDAERIQSIIDKKYSKQDLDQICDACKRLSTPDKKRLHSLLMKYENLFDGTLGTWKTDPVQLELKDPEAKPYHAKPYPVPQAHEQALREEIARLVEYGVLRKVNRSEWASPMFTIRKLDMTLRTLADLRELNKRIRRQPFPLPKIQDLLQRLEGFEYATSLDLNMGYYHILFS